jgi:arabinofuranan 3-O-arabinosyltransferase
LKLAVGVHEIEVGTTPRSGSAFDVGRLVLTSAAGGAAAPSGTILARRPASAVDTEVLDEQRTAMTVRVNPSNAKPFWLVLGQSNNRGWTARVDGHDLGPPQLVDGFANGWLIEPGSKPHAMTIEIEWTPQRRVAQAIAISAVASAGCVAIVILPVFRRRRRGVPLTADPQPTLRPIHERRTFTSRRSRALVAASAALLGALLVHPIAGVVLAALVFGVLLRPAGRAILRFAPAALLLVIGAYIAISQFVNRYPPRFDWPTFFDLARIPAWIALLLLCADAVLTEVEEDRPSGSDADD